MELSKSEKIMITVFLIALTLIFVSIHDALKTKTKTIMVKSTTPHEIRISKADTTYIYKGELIR